MDHQKDHKCDHCGTTHHTETTLGTKAMLRLWAADSGNHSILSVVSHDRGTHFYQSGEEQMSSWRCEMERDEH